MSKEKKKVLKGKYVDRELSWLSFNERVLQEAEDNSVPLLMRIKFLGIFSNNLDEFFRVRVASLKRLAKVKEVKGALGFSPKKKLKLIHQTVVRQQKKFETIYEQILKELADEHIYMVNEKELTDEQGRTVRNYFHDIVRPLLVPLMLNQIPEFPRLKDGSIYLAIHLSKEENDLEPHYALVELPTNRISRFFVFDRTDDNGAHVILLDDVVRYCLEDVFSIFGYNYYSAYTIKITKDAEMDFDHDVSKSFLELISLGVKMRRYGQAVRLIHDHEMPPDLLRYIIEEMNASEDDTIIGAGRYHNFKDFMDFPKLGGAHLDIRKRAPLPHPAIDPKKSLLSLLKKQDIMLALPYQTFHPVIDFLREAAIDPDVLSIKTTVYRLAKQSSLVNALLVAKKNGKDVTVAIELQARFDEANNIKWAKELQEAGIKVVHGQPGLKIHAKLLLISRRESGRIIRYANIGTGNFHEGTAKLYSDHQLMTANQAICREVEQVFQMIQTGKRYDFQHLLVSPYYMYNRLQDMIDREIEIVKRGGRGYIIAKLNSLNDKGMMKKIHQASKEGVEVRLIIRGICCIVPDSFGNENGLEATSIVDKYLEHSRVILFGNGGDERAYIASADWLERNLHRRIEVACPVYDPKILLQLKIFLSKQLQDNTKSRWLNHKVDNQYNRNKKYKVRAQNALYDYFEQQLYPDRPLKLVELPELKEMEKNKQSRVKLDDSAILAEQVNDDLLHK